MKMGENDPAKRVTLTVGYDKNNVYIYVAGEATMMIASTLKKFIFDIVGQFESATEHNIFINLSDCKYMDSTFIGTLIIVEKKCVDILSKHILISKPSIYCEEVLQNMGLLKVFTITEEMPVSENIHLTELIMRDIDRLENAILMFQAHEELSNVSQENKKQFKLVTETLKKEIEKEQKKRNENG